MSNLVELFYHALNEPLGVWIKSSDPLKLKYSLYIARKRAGDPTLDHLQIRTDPEHPESTLWIVNPDPSSDAR